MATFNPFRPLQPFKRAVRQGFINKLAGAAGVNQDTGQFEGWAPGTGPIRDRLTQRFGQQPPVSGAETPTEPPINEQGEQMIDETRQQQLDAIDRALAMFKGGDGMDSLTGRVRGIVDPMLQTITDRTGRVEGQIGEAKSAAKKGVEDAEARRKEIVDTTTANFNKLYNDWDSMVQEARDNWASIKDEFKDTAALQTQGVVAGMRANADKMASQLRAQAEAAGVPRDQIEAQVRTLKMDTMFETGRVMGEAAARVNDRMAEINMGQSQILAGLQGQGLGTMTGAFGTAVEAHIQSSMQVLQAEKNRIDTEIAAGAQELELNAWITGVQETAAGLVANTEIMSTQAVQALETLRTQIEQGEVENWMQWQVAFSTMMDMLDNLFIETQT